MVRSWDEDVPRIIPRTESDGGSDIYGSGHSEVTLGERDYNGRAVGSLDRRSGEQYEEKTRPSSNKDGEDGGEKTPPQPVGFFDPRLSKVRSKAFLMWAATSKQSIYVSEPRLTLTRYSRNACNVHSLSHVYLLGRTVSRRAKPPITRCLRGGL